MGVGHVLLLKVVEDLKCNASDPPLPRSLFRRRRSNASDDSGSCSYRRNGTLSVLPKEQRILEQLWRSSLALKDCIETSRNKLGGVPVLKGSGFPVHQVLSQLADGDSIDDLAENFELDRDQLSMLLHALATSLNRPS